MSGMRSLNGPSDSQSHFSGKHFRIPLLEIDSWMPNKIQAISPLVDRLMRLECWQCVPGDEFERWKMRSCMAIRKIQGKKVHIHCRWGPGNEITIVVTDQGRGFNFGKIVGKGFP